MDKIKATAKKGKKKCRNFLESLFSHTKTCSMHLCNDTSSLSYVNLLVEFLMMHLCI